MPASKAKHLSSLFRSAIRTSASASASASAEDVALKQYVSSINTSFTSFISQPTAVTKRSSKSKKSEISTSNALTNLAVQSLKLESDSLSADSTKQLSKEISSILCGDTDSDFGTYPNSEETNGGKPLRNILDVPWFSTLSNNNISLHRKEISRERKQKWVFKSSQTNRLDRLVKMCAQKLGADATVQVFGKLGRETGVKEYNALIAVFIDKARNAENEDFALEQLANSYRLLTLMRDHGFQIQDQTYGPILMYLIDMGMITEFFYFCGVIRDENSVSRLAYYEMLLWIGVNDEDKIQELCNKIAADDGGGKPEEGAVVENYMIALCNSDRKKELLQILKTFDITKVLSVDCMKSIFKSLGRLSLDSLAENFLLELRVHGGAAESISSFIYDYAASMPNLAVEDVILKFKNLHADLEITPSVAPYEMLVGYCCNLLKVHEALDIVEQMLEPDMTFSMDTFNSILNACEESCEYNLVHRIYAMICRHNLKPNNETFRSMISLSVKIKDFEGAYGMINDLEKMNLMPTASMYNAIMAGYYREKNTCGALKVLKLMKDADVQPDSQTFSYLIGNCNSEENIVKYYEELRHSGVQVTKHVYMALINAYSACGQFEKAKEVVLEKGIPVKNLNEIKSVLVSALASHGQISDALRIYEEIKQSECNLEPKAIICLIEHLQWEGKLSILLQLLEQLSDPDYWLDGCFRIILYCVRHKHLSSAIDLLKQVKDEFCNDEVAAEVLFDEVFCHIAEMEPTGLQIGLDLLRAFKEEIGLRPSRKSLDFLLTACVNAKDLKTSYFVWKEYRTAGLPYNVLSFVRMYQALLACGDRESAAIFLKKIPKDDPHVRAVIKKCQAAYFEASTGKGKKKKKKLGKDKS